MALALVRSVEQTGDRLLLDVDTGTNPLYRVRIGREVRDDDGRATLDDVFWESPWSRNPQAGRGLDTRVRVSVPAEVAEPRCLLQVVTAKDGPRALAFSRPRRLSVAPAAAGLGPGPGELAMSTAVASQPIPATFAVPSMTGVRSAREAFSRPASLDDLIGSLVRAALPLVQQLLAGEGSGGSTPGGTGSPPGNDSASLVAGIAHVLRAALGAAASPSTVQPQSVGRPVNRFRDDLAGPLVFGIDDALIASLAGPVLSALTGPLLERLPELLNSASQHRLDARTADYQLIGQLIASADRNRIADRIAALGSAAPAASDATSPATSDLAALLELLRSATAPAAGTGTGTAGAAASASGSTGAATTGTAAPHSLPGTSTTASRVQLVPVVAAPVTWSGRQLAVFVRDRAVSLRWRLDAGPGGPTSPLPRAILRLVVRRAGAGADLLSREARLTDVAPGSEVGFQLEPSELAGLPADAELEAFAQLRWPVDGGSRQCTSSLVLAFTAGAHVVASGAPAGEHVELTDMTRYRPFWNKVWASPPATEDRPLWGIDVTLRYSVVLTDAPANALMEVRALAGEEAGSLRATTTGRMRSGIELSVHELAKLRASWPDAAPIDAATEAAFAAPGWLATQGGDAEVAVRFDGRRRTRGLVWAVPVPALRTFTVARPSDVDHRGQVIAVVTSDVAFPVIEAVRVLGLVSTGDTEAGEDATADGVGSSYGFEGHQVVYDTLVGLEPAGPAPSGGAP